MRIRLNVPLRLLRSGGGLQQVLCTQRALDEKHPQLYRLLNLLAAKLLDTIAVKGYFTLTERVD